MRLNGKVAAITAAGSGMGRAGAVLFAREGAKVVVGDIDAGAAEETARMVTAAGGEAVVSVGDMLKDDDCDRLTRDAVSAFGGLDILWAHAGHPGPASVEGLDMKDYETAMDLNVRSALRCAMAAIPEMRARGGGSIVFTASVAGLAGSAFSPVYSAAKFGVVGLTQSLAIRVAPDKIRVNVVCPGPIETPMLAVFMGRPDQQTDAETNLKNMRAFVPLGRTGAPEEVAAAALFLASDDASYVTGVALPVDGGFTAR